MSISIIGIGCDKVFEDELSIEKDFSLISDSLTISSGHKHNLILENYFDQYATDSYNITESGIDTLESRIIIGKFINILKQIDPNFTMDADSLSESLVSHLISNGQFDMNGNAISLKLSDEILISNISHDGIRSAISNIHSYNTENIDDLVNYKNIQFAYISTSSILELNFLDSYSSIIEESYEIWSGGLYNKLSTKNKLIAVAKADAMGASDGLDWCIDNDQYNPMVVSNVMTVMAAYYSYRVTQI